ncbi:MAG: ATP-binding protein [Candidatus Hydrogenedentota bacterium]
MKKKSLETKYYKEDKGLRDSLQLYEKLIDFVTAIHSTLDFDRLINLLLNKILQILQAEVGTLLLFDRTGVLYPRAWFGIEEDIINKLYIGKEGVKLSSLLLTTEKVEYFNDVIVRDDTKVFIKNLLIIPLMDGEKHLSTIIIANRTDSIIDEKIVIEYIKSQVTIAVKNAYKVLNTEETLSEIATLYDYTQVLQQAANFEEMATYTLNTFESIFGFRGVFVELVIDKEKVERYKGLNKDELDFINIIMEKGQFPFMSNEDKFVLMVEVKGAERIYGYVYCSKEKVPNYRVDSFYKSLSLFSEQLALYIERLRIYLEAQKSGFIEFAKIEDLAHTKGISEDLLYRYFGRILDELPVGIFLVDVANFSIIFNREFKRLFNIDIFYPHQDKRGLLRDIIGEEIYDAFLKVSKDEIQRFYKEFEKAIEVDNKIIFDINLSQIKNTKNELSYVVGIVRDISGQKKIEEGLRRAERLAALGELSLGVAHEIKNPLTSIKGFSQLLTQKSTEPGFIDKYVKIITDEVERLNHIVEELISFARPGPIEISKIEIDTLINRIASLLSREFEKYNIVFQKEFDGSIKKIEADESQLTQVLLNVFLNSIQAMQKNGGLLKVSVKPPSNDELRKYNIGADYYIISVHDTGIGIPQENLNKLFNPFFTTKENGTGLGLSISLRIIEKHNGKIDVESEPGYGTTFKIILPQKLGLQ